jgi:ParB-like chromosome segregation protein Spo0J
VHSERQINQLAKSIKSFGFLWPVMIDGTRRVLAGHGRIEAAKRLGFQEVPTISIHHLSESQRRAFVIADNRLAEQASWDEKLLAEQFRELREVELEAGGSGRGDLGHVLAPTKQMLVAALMAGLEKLVVHRPAIVS